MKSMNAFFYKLQSLPERRRYIIMQATFISAGLIVFLLVGISITSRISTANEPKFAPTPINRDSASEQASAASPAEGFLKSFGPLKGMIVNENLIQREKHGFIQLGLIAGEYIKDAKNGIMRFVNYISEQWLTKEISH